MATTYIALRISNVQIDSLVTLEHDSLCRESRSLVIHSVSKLWHEGTAIARLKSGTLPLLR